jgi:hypothetical protein
MDAVPTAKPLPTLRDGSSDRPSLSGARAVVDGLDVT